MAIIRITKSEIQQISHEFQYDMQTSDISGWTHSNSTISRLVTCGGYQRFGEFGSKIQGQRGNSWAYKDYNNLPPHYSLSVQLELIEIRSLDSEFFSVLIDNSKVWYGNSYNYGWSSSSRYCTGGAGQSWAKVTRNRVINVNVTHSSDNFQLKLESEVDSGAYDESWAVSNLYINVDECHETCLTCSGPSRYDCLTCPTGSYQYGSSACLCDGVTFAQEHQCINNCESGYTRNNTNMSCYNSCPQNCNSCSSLQQCTSCDNNYYLLNGLCVNHCPFYTTLQGSTCVDNDFNSATKPYLVTQDFTDQDFSTSQIIENGWRPSIWESKIQSGVERVYTTLASEKCNGLQLGLGNSFNLLYNCTPSCQFSNNFDNLPNHWGYNLKAQLWLGDDWQGETVNIKVDDQIVKSQSHTLVPGTRNFDCGLNSAQASSQYIYNIELNEQVHQSQTLNLNFEWSINNIALKQWVGLRDVQLTLLQCSDLCSECTNGTTCTKCNPTRTNIPNCDQPAAGYFDDGANEINFRRCSYQCAECQGTADNCTKCRYYDDPLKLPQCGKPDNCLNYAKSDSVGYFQIHLGSVNFIMDDFTIQSTSRGIVISQFDQNANFVDYQAFDTHSDVDACKNLITYVDSIPNFSIVMLSLYDASVTYLTENCIYSLETIGWNRNQDVILRDAYTIISRKKDYFKKTDVQDFVKYSVTTYYAHAEKCVIECDFQCAECSGTPSNCTFCRFYQATPAPTCGMPQNCLTFVDLQSRGADSGSFNLAQINQATASEHTTSRGFNFVEVDENGTVYSAQGFDVYDNNQAVLDMETYIENIPNDRYLLGTIKDEGSRFLNKYNNSVNQGYEALLKIGYPIDQELQHRDAFTIIGKKGSNTQNINYQISRQFDIGSSHIQQCLKNCHIKCATCTTSYDNCSSCSSNLRDQTTCDLPNNCGKFIYLKSTGFFHDKWNADPQQIQIQINDIDVTFSQNNGVHILVLDEQGQVDSTQSFDYSSDTTQLTNMINFINGITTGRKVLVVSKDDMSINITASGYTALQSLGLPDTVEINLRESFTMLGQKGLTQGSAEYTIGLQKPGATQLQGCAMGCQYQCATCQMETYNCLSCSHSTRPSTSDCECQIGTFDVGVPECSECDYKCETCETNKNNCLTCADTNRDINNSCLCKDSWYNQGTQKLCVKCPNKFAKCTSDTVGLECQGANRSSTLNSCPCNTGYYDDNTNSADCVKCNAKCTICTSDSVCSECSDGYYLSGTSCIQCPNKFAKCSSATVGIQCAIGIGRTTNIPDCQCSEGYYDDNTNNVDCIQCSHPCINCINNSLECTECHPDQNRNDKPGCNCIQGYFEETNKTCSICTSPCLQCIENTNKCTVCINTTYRKDIPTCDCLSGYFENDNKICQICQYPCKECIGTSLTCQECVEDVSRIQDNTCKCKDGTFDNGSKCENCDLNKCNTCENSPEECIICADTTRGGNECNCLNGFFDLGVAQCEKCNYQCGTCISQKDNCLSCSDQNRDINKNCTCIDTFYDDGMNSECIKCQYPCLNCKNQNLCLSCQGLYRHGINCNCQQGFFEKDNQPDCQTCSIKCSACQNQVDQCLICRQGKYRTLIVPNCGCQDGYYEIENQMDCNICDSKCKTCEKNTGKCILCNNSEFQVPDCLQENNSSYLETILDSNNQQIIIQKNCQFQCAQCEGDSSNCTKCIIGKNRISQKPSCQCLTGYHDNNQTTSDCFKCVNNCLTCKSVDHCLSCDQTQNRLINPLTQTCDCAIGYKESQHQKGLCLPCFNYKGSCFEQCPLNTVQDLNQKTCIDKNYKILSNTNIILVCFGVLVLLNILICLIFRFVTEKKLKMLNLKKQTYQSLKNQSLSEVSNNNNQKNSNSDNQV